MMNRRTFLRNSGLAAASGLLLSNALKANALFAAEHSVGIQLFTVMKEMDQDVKGTLKKIADLGYKDIESAFSMKGGYYGMKPKEFAAMLKDMGLSWRSHHVLGAPFKMPAGSKPLTDASGKPIVIPPMRNLRDNYQELVDEIAEGGAPYLVCASTPVGTTEEVKNSAEVLSKTGEACKKVGVTLAYHNHDAEFKDIDGKKPYDYFLTQISADHLKFELDLGWASKAGVDPVELFKKNKGRFPLWHVKDFDKAFKNIVSVGSGIVDFKRIFAAADSAGMKYFFIEHDFPANAFESLSASITYLKKEILHA